MKSTEEASSGCSSQMFQISPVVTGTLVWRFDPLDELDEVGDLLLAAIDGFVADDDAVDVAVAAGELDRRLHLALVAVDIFVDPGADRDLEPDLIGDRRVPVRRRRWTNRDGSRASAARAPQVGADFFLSRDVVDVGMASAVEWRVGHARQNAAKFSGSSIVAGNRPEASMNASDQCQHSQNDTHQIQP
jgi:hypothetical protein